MSPEESNYEPIEDYGIIGNLHTVALVSKNGSIDFMSYTRFDSPTVFAALLDSKKGGNFSIRPQLDDSSNRQMYLPDTAILITRVLSDDGIAEIMDFMPINTEEHHCAIIRIVTTIRGNITYEMNCCPRFNYSRAEHEVTALEDRIEFATDYSDHVKMIIHSDVPMEIKGKDVWASFTLDEKQQAFFILESAEHEQQRQPHVRQYIKDSYKNTLNYWQQWVETSKYRGRWLEMVNRSAITLKLLTSYKYGSPVAAATFGLPETVGGERNWDYRYTWIRDASFTMYIFLKLGFMDEAAAFLAWIQRQCEAGELQLMYAVDGRASLTEKNIDYWEGYKKSQPVRIGNKAHEQFQLDVYGELMDTIYLYDEYGGHITYEFWKIITTHVQVVMEKWQEPDHGIWEIRSDKKEFLYSRLMCWVAIDRAIKVAERRSFPYPQDKWHATRDDIFYSIYNDFWDEEMQSFVQYKGSKAIDASALMMPLRRFISPDEDKWKKTMQAIDNHLRTDVLIYRYNNRLNKIDGLEGTEGTFSMCSFWYVECLARTGEIEKAREHFEKMLGYTNHVGLFAEEIGHRGEQLGNYPQAFTHLALISAAITLDKLLEKKQ